MRLPSGSVEPEAFIAQLCWLHDHVNAAFGKMLLFPVFDTFVFALNSDVLLFVFVAVAVMTCPPVPAGSGMCAMPAASATPLDRYVLPEPTKPESRSAMNTSTVQFGHVTASTCELVAFTSDGAIILSFTSGSAFCAVLTLPC